ncbi:MAG: GTP-binding protein [Candidatus Lokiarchaeota archaeon]|nr:GTP-binding protein [Candidatus Lokiarchaeota archaeon]MBD3342316.1 GTP-binding protein [Candidatus Lokiarchaeota archaeon]
MSNNEKEINQKIVNFICPICKAEKKLKISSTVINEAKQLTTISIQKNEVCKHHFQAFVDKNFNVRGYQKVDYEIKARLKLPKGDYSLKIIIIGDFKAGKSAIARRFVEDAFIKEYIPTLQLEISNKSINIEDTHIKVVIWDIGGQVISNTPFRKQFYELAQLAIIVVDRTRKNTLENAERWYRDAIRAISDKVPFILVGNKSDLMEDIVVSEEEIKEEANRLNVDYLLTSAKTGDNISELFFNLTHQYFESLN